MMFVYFMHFVPYDTVVAFIKGFFKICVCRMSILFFLQRHYDFIVAISKREREA